MELPKCIYMFFKEYLMIWTSLTVVRCTECEESTVKGMDVCIVLHFYGNCPGDVAEALGAPPASWSAVEPGGEKVY